MKDYFLETPYGQIHYVIEGSGEPVILLHQSPRSIDEYAEVMPILAPKYRVIAMDTLGYGASDKPADVPTLDVYAETVIMLMDALGLKKANFVGHHTGAKIAQLVAITYPDRVDKLVLSSPGLLESEEMKKAAEEAFSKLWAVEEDGSHISEVWQFWKQHAPLTPELLNRIVLDHLRAGGGDGKTGPYGFMAVFRSDVDKHLSKIGAPTLLLWGTDDLTSFGFPKESEEKVNNAIPRTKVITIEGGTFATPNLKPEEFAQYVLDFLENPGV
jgi:pimeloyl-ACP methyl ester carboxylesterase